MKITHFTLVLSCLLMVSCSSSKSGMQSDAAGNNSNAASSNQNSPSKIRQPTADLLNEEKATEVLREFVNHNYSNSYATITFLSTGPFFPNENKNTIEVRLKYLYHHQNSGDGSVYQEERTGEARFERAQNGKWYLTVVSVAGIKTPDIEIQ
ncbi:MAG TPA: hypothetical protein VJ843_00515 [Candidatus Saccharimonadales bacterium]|nr:hypothetical protein [Candidatus Saccharimonadales bacterium]